MHVLKISGDVIMLGERRGQFGAVVFGREIWRRGCGLRSPEVSMRALPEAGVGKPVLTLLVQG